MSHQNNCRVIRVRSIRASAYQVFLAVHPGLSIFDKIRVWWYAKQIERAIANE